MMEDSLKNLIFFSKSLYPTHY